MALEANTTMPNSAEIFRANKAVRIAEAKSRLCAISQQFPSCSGQTLEVEAILNELDEMVEQAVRIKADTISAAITERAAAERAAGAPALCSSCLRLMTETDYQLNDYIELVVREARNLSWPDALCRGKLRQAMRAGDRIAELGYGRMRVVRPDGSGFWIFQRES